MSQGVLAATIAFYLAGLVGVGWIVRRRQSSFRDYVTGGGGIPGWMLAISFLANYVSSNSFVGHASKTYEVGLCWLGIGGVMVACATVAWWLFAPRFARFAARTGATTLPDLFDHLWGRRASRVVAAIVVVGTLLFVLAVLQGTAIVIAQGLSVSTEVALLVAFGVAVVYAGFGGFWADVSTDVVQGVVLMAGAIALFVGVLLAPAGTPAPDDVRPVPLAVVLAAGLGGGLKMLSDPKQVMVFYAFRDEASARRFRFTGPLLLLVVYAALLPVGYLARRIVALPAGAKVETLVPTLAMSGDVLPGWFAPIFLIALLAASMSSLDSALLIMASCAEKHFVAPALGREPSSGRTRVLLAAFAVVAVLIAARPPDGIIPLTTLAGALVGASLLPSVAAALFGLRVGPRAVLASISSGAAGSVFGYLASKKLAIWGGRPLVESPWCQDVLVGLVCATAVLALGTALGAVRARSAEGAVT